VVFLVFVVLVGFLVVDVMESRKLAFFLLYIYLQTKGLISLLQCYTYITLKMEQ